MPARPCPRLRRGGAPRPALRRPMSLAGIEDGGSFAASCAACQKARCVPGLGPWRAVGPIALPIWHGALHCR
eukprot:13867254-Alexandrium_andersonii.AAC.1